MLFSKPTLLIILRLPERKILDPDGPYISKSQTNVRNVCLSIIFDLLLARYRQKLKTCFNQYIFEFFYPIIVLLLLSPWRSVIPRFLKVSKVTFLIGSILAYCMVIQPL